MAKTKYASTGLFPRGKNPPEYSTKPGAQLNAEAIESYWHERGHEHVKVDVIRRMTSARKRHTDPIFGLQSNLVDGSPPRIKRENAA